MTNVKTTRSMELLAPAGSVESFHAAIDAGANAVYLGLTDFNARLRAKNFTMKTLSYAVPFAHSRNVKVYVTFNILVKQAELEQAVHVLYQLEQIGVDAIIVQDMGIINIARTAFPRLRLHASTQMSVHNAAGAATCRRLGIRRAVVARELTLAEISQVCAARECEIEVFCHGALCYSLSGMCLASSFFGGASGNRGRCTQVCRRAFDILPKEQGEKPGYFFSPSDLSAIGALPQLTAAGVACVKIEGRMKSADYVRTVVSAYRMALDDPNKTGAAQELLKRDFGRRKTGLFLGGVVQEGIIDKDNPGGTGIYIGKIDTVQEQRIAVHTAERLNQGDILRIQPQDGSEGVMAGVAEFSNDSGVLTVHLDKSVSCTSGDTVYYVGTGAKSSVAGAAFPVKPVFFRERYADVRDVLKPFVQGGRRDGNRDRRLFVKIDSYEWLALMKKPQIGGVICSFDKNDAARLANDDQARTGLGRAGYIEPPPFIAGEELGEWRRLVETLCAGDQCGLMCQNLGHAALAKGIKRVRADSMLWCMNRAAQAAYAGLGPAYFAYSPEDDSMNIRDTASQNGMAYLFTNVPLFISRVQPALTPGSRIADRVGRTTVAAEKNGLYYLLAEETVSLFHKRTKLEEIGIRMFCIDMSFMKPDEKVLSELLDCYDHEKKYPGSCLFNFKGGLK